MRHGQVIDENAVVLVALVGESIAVMQPRVENLAVLLA